MKKFSFWHFMLAWAIIEDEQRKRAETVQLRQENKRTAQKIRQQNPSTCLGQHKYMYLSKRSR